jgi:hypothetical protein
MRKFLLMAGDNYYPSAGVGDWIGCFETEEEARSQVIFHNGYYEISGSMHDWFKIINLENWIN